MLPNNLNPQHTSTVDIYLVLKAVYDDLEHDRTLNIVLDRVFWIGVWKDVKEFL